MTYYVSRYTMDEIKQKYIELGINQDCLNKLSEYNLIKDNDKHIFFKLCDDKKETKNINSQLREQQGGNIVDQLNNIDLKMNDVIQVRNKIVNLVFLWPATMGKINQGRLPDLDPKLRSGFFNLPSPKILKDWDGHLDLSRYFGKN